MGRGGASSVGFNSPLAGLSGVLCLAARPMWLGCMGKYASSSHKSSFLPPHGIFPWSNVITLPSTLARLAYSSLRNKTKSPPKSSGTATGVGLEKGGNGGGRPKASTSELSSMGPSAAVSMSRVPDYWPRLSSDDENAMRDWAFRHGTSRTRRH